MDGKENGRMGRGRIIRGGKLRVAKREGVAPHVARSVVCLSVINWLYFY